MASKWVNKRSEDPPLIATVVGTYEIMYVVDVKGSYHLHHESEQNFGICSIRRYPITTVKS